jgi:hypothetical protein
LVVKPQHLDVRLKPGAWVDPARMMQTIHDAGFKAVPEDVRLTVTGMVEKRGEALVIALDKTKTPVALAVVPHASTPETAPHLARHLGELVEVEGYWRPEGGGQLALTAIKVKGEPDGKHRD